ncbi:hypothetical protein KQI84_13085 [bacterium]|nr:hypothetical protein [bacterium]
MKSPSRYTAALLILLASLFLTGCFGPTPSRPLLLHNPPWQQIDAGTETILHYQTYSADRPEIMLEPIGPRKEAGRFSATQFLGAGRSTSHEDTVRYARLGNRMALPFSDDYGPPSAAFHTLLPPERSNIRRGDLWQGNTILILTDNWVRSETSQIRFLVSWVGIPTDRAAAQEGLPAITYPLWGLPRDLLDAPITFLRRCGFDRLLDPIPVENPRVAYWVSLGAVIGIAAAGPAAFLFAVTPWYMFMGTTLMVIFPSSVAVGAVAAFITRTALEFGFQSFINPLQVGALRGGVDSEDYFPNWKFGVRRERTLPSGAGEIRWVVTDIRRLP